MRQLKKIQPKVSEHIEQSRVVKWLLDRGIEDFFAVPNGYKKSVFEQSKAKREGLRSGVPDLIILQRPKGREDLAGVAIEMKRDMGKKHRLPCSCLEENQLIWKDKFIKQGWGYFLCHGADDAIKALEDIY